jgi:hypothetical protein
MDGVEKYARWFLAAVLVVFTWRFARMPIDGSATASFLHLPNLVFHEAGHVRLPLLGGATGAEVEGHDWEYLLGTLGWLHLDRGLGRAVQIAGVAVMLASTVWAAYGAWAIPSRAA